MFTSQPTVAQRVERMIADTPLIDPHCHIRSRQQNAPDLSSLMSVGDIQTELRSVGISASDLDPMLPDDERVRRAIPYLRRMRNTATAWTFHRILRDLYDFHDPDLSESNYRDVLDKICATGRDPAWASHILRDKCNLRTLVTDLGNRNDDPASHSENILYRLDAEDLFCPGVDAELTPFVAGRTAKTAYYEAISQLLGERPATTDRLAQLLRDWLDRSVRGPVRFSKTFLPIDQRLLPPDAPHVQLAIDRAVTATAMRERDVDTLVRFVTWEILGWHSDHKKALLIAIGSESVEGEGTSIPRFQETWTSDMARAFRHFGGARFVRWVASSLVAHEVVALARGFPNVYLCGYGSHAAFPDTIETLLSRRIQMVPMTKFGGFLSDAPYAEWVYGKLQVVKKAMASALGRLVETGFFEEHEIPPILHQILHDTPRALFDLGPT